MATIDLKTDLLSCYIFLMNEGGAGGAAASGYSAARPGAATNSTAAGGAKAARIWYKEDLSSVGFFYRSTLHDHIKFNARLLCERTPDGGRQSVAFENDMGRCFSQRLPGGLACAVVTSNKMEARLAFAIITTIMDQFRKDFDGQWQRMSREKDDNVTWKEGGDLFKKCQDPANVDKIAKIEKDLDEVKGMVMKSMDEILKRGENLDSLMEKSQDLSTTSYQFYRQAKKNNQCCQAY